MLLAQSQIIARARAPGGVHDHDKDISSGEYLTQLFWADVERYELTKIRTVHYRRRQ